MFSILSRGPPRFEGDRPRFGDRDGCRGGPRPGGPPGDLGDKGGAPPEFQPSFRVCINSYFICILSFFFFLSSKFVTSIMRSVKNAFFCVRIFGRE